MQERRGVHRRGQRVRITVNVGRTAELHEVVGGQTVTERVEHDHRHRTADACGTLLSSRRSVATGISPKP